LLPKKKRIGEKRPIKSLGRPFDGLIRFRDIGIDRLRDLVWKGLP
jgi:hypothetical protein